jgi:hypothetical protein
MKKRSTFILIVLLTTATLSWGETSFIEFTSIDIAFNNNYPLNDLSDYYSSGIGGGCQFEFDIIPINRLGLFIDLDYYYGISETIWVDSFHDLNLIIGASYELFSSGRFSLIPEIGYGISNHLLLGDVDRDGSNSTDYFIDQMVSVSTKGLFSINQKISVFLSPELTLYFEESNTAILLGYNLGARINL